uniref:histidine kinase n=1 Tax=uncultured bacterium FLS18 TaxID=654935 RepID=C6G409_9BACT|nr:sensory transduction histidine kinase [uncultured bacterium FLS18]
MQSHVVPEQQVQRLQSRVAALEQLLEVHERTVLEQSDKLARTLRQLEERAAALAERTEELARSNRELQEFAHAASHDLQEPLRAVSGFCQLLRDRYSGKLDVQADEFIGFAVDGAHRMQKLINDLLAYSRVGAQGDASEPTDSSAIFDQAVTNLHAAIQESGAKVTQTGLPIVTADPSQLIQLLQNLIGNAIKFRGERTPEIHVEASRKVDDWLFSVRDNGIGIEPRHAERVFLIFQRLHAQTKFPGTGVGLAICKKIVERHGGRIWIEPRSEDGTVVLFTIPTKDGDQS